MPPLPRGDGWMFVELVGEDLAELRLRADALLAAAGASDGFVVTDPAQAMALWKIREDGAGLAGISLARPAYPGWEDAAVPAEHLGSYLRDFDRLLDDHGLDGLPYGHFGDGCVHVRIDFPLTEAGGAAGYQIFVEEAAQLVAGYGGSLSGEHGDGRARSALLPAMYSAAALEVFGQVKAAFDPENLLNPGVLVDPRPVAADLRAVGLLVVASTTSRSRAPLLRRGQMPRQHHRRSGCDVPVLSGDPGGEGLHSRARAGAPGNDQWRCGAARLEVAGGARALDLCLSCKGCARDCPTGIDMAAYKSQVLDHTYRRKIRPRSHYALGWLPRWGRLITRARVLSRLVNLSTATPGVRSLVRWAAGIDQRRSLPRFASVAARKRVAVPAPAGAPAVVWVDSFSDCFSGDAVAAAVSVLADAGYAPQLVERPACCGLTWISTGQLDGARRQLRNALDILHPYIARGTPVVGLEPSCLAVWRSDAAELLPDDPRVADVAAGVFTLAELLGRTPNWTPPDLSGIELVVQPHCHHASVLGWQADATLLAATGATVTTVGGCCGLAGNFGVEKGHYEVSVKVAEHDLLPAVAAHPDALVLADGFSCRTQLAQLADRKAITLAELLADRGLLSG